LTHMTKTGEALQRKDYETLSRIHGDTTHNKAVAEAFRHFSARKYWTRLWVMQEFSVCIKISRLVLGRCAHVDRSAAKP
jgi:hypothetical protein